MVKDYDYKMDETNFSDMKKYNPNFDEESIKDMSDSEIRENFKKYYSEHLPVDLTTWSRVFEPKNGMSFKKGYFSQIVFVRDEVQGLLRDTYKEYADNPVMVISTHTSKSIGLPVYYIYLEKYDTQIIMRYNFYDWKVSINSKYEISEIEDFIIETKKPISKLYCEGFNENQIFGRYKDNNKKFTVELPDNFYLVYTFFYFVKRSLKKGYNNR